MALLTENPDSNKHLSPKFHGLIILSGCFTAAGHEVVPVNYDYAPFAHQVYNLLLRKGYQNFKVQGMAGPSVTTESGDKVVLPAKDAAAATSNETFSFVERRGGSRQGPSEGRPQDR